jgi:Anti-sigma-K factor rskA
MSDADDPRDVTDIEALLAELEVDDLDLATPPQEVWAGIERRTADDRVTQVAPAMAPPVSIDARRRPGGRWAMAAAAALVLVLAGAIVLANRGSQAEVLSSAVLTFDPTAFDPRGADATATAELIERSGRLEIRLRDVDLPSLTGDDLELWLIQPDADGNPLDIASVALVKGSGSGSYQVPAGLDPDSHYVVDISIEPHDGDAAHSGQSILRGALQSG